jgi:hypothetical protein
MCGMVGFAIQIYLWLFRILIVWPLKFVFRAVRSQARRNRQRRRYVEAYQRRAQEWNDEQYGGK